MTSFDIMMFACVVAGAMVTSAAVPIAVHVAHFNAPIRCRAAARCRLC